MKFTSIAALVAVTQALTAKDKADTIEALHSLVDSAQVVDNTFSSSEYMASDASAKKDALWEKCIADKTSGSFPEGAAIGGIFLESMAPTFTTKGDQMPKELLGLKTRTKYIHSVGTVGKVKFVSNGNHPFTGVWEGAQHGIVRLSSAAKPSDHLAPGLGLKFLRDGVDSADLVAMYGVNGTPGDWNFFEKDFTNHIKAAKGAALEAVAIKFSTETPWIQSVGLSDFAQIGEDGRKVDAPVFPFEMRFHPNKEVATLISNAKPDDDMAYIGQLESFVPADATLYDIYGLDAPTELGGVEHFMGTLQLDGKLTRSKWGDE